MLLELEEEEEAPDEEPDEAVEAAEEMFSVDLASEWFVLVLLCG